MRPRRPLLLAVAALLVTASPAAAASGITSPGADEVVTSDRLVLLRATVDGPALGPSELTLQGPGDAAAEVVAVHASPQGGELAYDFDTACARRACVGRVPAANGSWTVRLSGAASDERSFVLRIPPAAPTEVAADSSESGALLRWRQGAEPDLTGYAVEDAAGTPVLSDIGLEACDAEGTCRAELPEKDGAWAVRAFRSTCPGCSRTLRSPPSEVVRVGAASGTAVPGPAGPAAPGSSTGPSDRPAGPQGPAQKDAFRQAYGAGRPVALAAPSAGGSTPAGGQPASVAPPPDGSYDPALDYATPPEAPRPALSRAQDAVEGAVPGSRLQLIVLSVVMIGSSLWLRRWARRAAPVPVAGSHGAGRSPREDE
ncbi:MAG: hypothetical protein WD794_06860 [Mycobacteriales bacterium]